MIKSNVTAKKFEKVRKLKMVFLKVSHASIATLCLRSILPSDKESIAHHANNFNLSKYLNNQFPFPYGPQDAEYFLTNIVEPKPDITLAIATDKELIGVIGLVDHMKDYRDTLSELIGQMSTEEVVEIGYWLSENYWGQGIMRKALETFIFEHLRVKYPRVSKVIARVIVENKASIAVLKKVGFVSIGSKENEYQKNGRFWNLEYLSLQISDSTRRQ